MAIENGHYLTLEKNDSGLLLTLTEAGKEYLDDHFDSETRKFSRSDECLFADLMEDYFASSWEHIRPEDIGALTSADIISDDVVRDEEGNIDHIGTVYAYMDYQIKSHIEELYHGRECRFQAFE